MFLPQELLVSVDAAWHHRRMNEKRYHLSSSCRCRWHKREPEVIEIIESEKKHFILPSSQTTTAIAMAHGILAYYIVVSSLCDVLRPIGRCKVVECRDIFSSLLVHRRPLFWLHPLPPFPMSNLIRSCYVVSVFFACIVAHCSFERMYRNIWIWAWG